MAAARHDAEAFHTLYVRHAARIHAQQLRQTRDPDAPHDLTAETFAQAWIVRERFRDEAGGSVLPWLLGIARNVLLMSVRCGRIERLACERLGLHERLDEPPAAVEPDASWLDGLDELLRSCLRANARPCAFACSRTMTTRASPRRSAPRPKPPACACTARCGA